MSSRRGGHTDLAITGRLLSQDRKVRPRTVPSSSKQVKQPFSSRQEKVNPGSLPLEDWSSLSIHSKHVPLSARSSSSGSTPSSTHRDRRGSYASPQGLQRDTHAAPPLKRERRTSKRERAASRPASSVTTTSPHKRQVLEEKDDCHGDSVELISSEIEEILSGITRGAIMSSPGEECSGRGSGGVGTAGNGAMSSAGAPVTSETNVEEELVSQVLDVSPPFVKEESSSLVQSGQEEDPPLMRSRQDENPPLVRSGQNEDPPLVRSGQDEDPPLVRSGQDEDPPLVRSGQDEDPPLVRSGEEEKQAVVCIQRWYRKKMEQRKRRERGELAQWLREHHHKQVQDREKTLRKAQDKELEKEKDEAERQRRRAAKMQATRKAAIETLKQKREQKRQEMEQVVQEEMTRLEVSGKVHKAPPAAQGKRKRKMNIAATLIEPQVKQEETPLAHPLTAVQDKKMADIPSAQEHKPQGEVAGETPSDSLVEELFKAGPRRMSQSSPRDKPHPKPHPQTSTLDSIMATLEQLEEAPPALRDPGTQEPGADCWTTPQPASPGYLSASNLHKLAAFDQHQLPNNKLHNIFSYLDQVEHSDDKLKSTLELARAESEKENSGGGGEHSLHAATSVASDVTTTIMAQRVEIENKKKTIAMLQKALTQQREFTVYHTREMEKDAQKRLEVQRQEVEATVQRHQCFIDQLIEDKKVLGDKCEMLVREMKDTAVKYKSKIKALEESHAAELEKVRQSTATADKLRRERWKADETQRIKEATVRSLEPEIQRIIARGKAEMQKLRALHEAELLQSDERASRKFLQQTEELRTQLAQEKELACTHERELARQKYEQLAEQEEHSYQQLRRKLYSELQQERDKATVETRAQRDLLERQLSELKESHHHHMEEMRSEHQTTLNEIQRKHSNEIRELQQEVAVEKRTWEEQYMKRQEAGLLGREREMREELRRERDKEIDTVIHRLEEETAANKEECERACESRVRRIREKCEAELREVEQSERQTLQKYNNMKCQLTEMEGELLKVRTLLRQREQEVVEVTDVASHLSKERDHVTDIVRQEFADRLFSTEEENRQVKMELVELKARHKAELQGLTRAKERALEEVHQRVKQALTKKEENLKNLQAQHEAALKRAEHLEMLLERQRRELLNT